MYRKSFSYCIKQQRKKKLPLSTRSKKKNFQQSRLKQVDKKLYNAFKAKKKTLKSIMKNDYVNMKAFEYIIFMRQWKKAFFLWLNNIIDWLAK